jgi:putative Holliday junction resolvase
VRLLALDVGDRRVGVAVSDPSGLIATPLAVIHRASKVQDFAKVAQFVREQDATGVVVGHPLNADGSEGPQARRVERYAAALAEALHGQGLDVALVLWDERLSTVQAQEAMITSGRKARDRRRRIDAVAAAVILQDYLDVQRAGHSQAGFE